MKRLSKEEHRIEEEKSGVLVLVLVLAFNQERRTWIPKASWSLPCCPIVRLPCTSAPLSLSPFLISTFHSFPLSNLQSTIILVFFFFFLVSNILQTQNPYLHWFFLKQYIFFNWNIRQNQRHQESQPLSQCRMRRYDSTLLYYCVFMYWLLIIDVFEFTTGKGKAVHGMRGIKKKLRIKELVCMMVCHTIVFNFFICIIMIVAVSYFALFFLPSLSLGLCLAL